MKKIWVFSGMGVALFVGVAAFGMVTPGVAACALLGMGAWDALPDGTLVEQGASAAARERVQTLLQAAKGRIHSTFGAPRAAPIVVFFESPLAFGFWKVNTYGSTNLIGPRACVMVGPQGQNVDVVAHELMHAELVDRVGYVRRWTEVPVWFDEGVAMQLDYRPRYDLPRGGAAEWIDTAYVRQLQTARQFFQASDAQLTRNYAAAKAEVAHGLAVVGAPPLYQRLERIREGAAFGEIWVD